LGGLIRWVGWWLGEVGGGYGYGGYGCGFGTQDAGAEGYGLPVVLGEEGHFFGGPAAFGAYGEGGFGVLCEGLCGGEGGGEGGGLFGLAEEDAGGAFLLFEGGLEGGGIGDLGDVGAAGLLGGFEGDATPAFDAFGGGLGEVFFGAAGEDGGDAGDAEFGGLLDGPLHVVELEDGQEEMEGKGGVGFELFVEGEEDLGFGDAGDFSAVEEAVGDDVVDLAGFGTEDAGEVDGLVAGEGCGGGGAGVGDPTTAGHASILLYSGSGGGALSRASLARVMRMLCTPW
jgi:hypothetical protein